MEGTEDETEVDGSPPPHTLRWGGGDADGSPHPIVRSNNGEVRTSPHKQRLWQHPYGWERQERTEPWKHLMPQGIVFPLLKLEKGKWIRNYNESKEQTKLNKEALQSDRKRKNSKKAENGLGRLGSIEGKDLTENE